MFTVLARSRVAGHLAAGWVVLLWAVGLPSSSLASTTFGADLSATPNGAYRCSTGCALANTILPAGSPMVTSPMTGTIVRWRVKTGSLSNSGTITFRVIAPTGGGNFTGAGTGDTESSPGTSSTTTFTARVPVQAGDFIGLNLSAGGSLNAFTLPGPGANVQTFSPPLADGGTAASGSALSGYELMLNADVAALPTSSVTIPACSATGQLPATVTSDPDSAVAPKSIHFRIDDSGEQVVATGRNPGTVTIPVPNGSHTLEYWAEDTVGGLESPHHTTSVQVGCATKPPIGAPPTGAPPTGAPPTGTPPTGTPLATPPSLTGVSQSHRRWRLGSNLARFAAAANPPIGTRFQFTLNEAATVRFAFAQLLPGRNAKGKCVAQTARNRRHEACARRVPRGSLSFSAGVGPHKLFFQGRLTRENELKPGTYALTITATNAAGQRASKTLSSFTIVPG